jgi:hypothetical protein
MLTVFRAQDLEYKLSGIQREFAGRIGSATFPHGAISLWDRELLVKTFHEHPGFSVSEDWFFGHVARQLGCRITMCSHVFVETETPTAVFFSSGGSRGGFGEMTIFKQRFKRWNFFFVNGMWYNMAYIFGNWKLGWWEIGAKIFVFQEVSSLRSLCIVRADMTGLRNTTLSSYAVHPTDLIRCTPCVLRYPPWINHRHVPDQRHHLQRDPPETQEGATGLATTLCVLSAIQDCTNLHQCRKLLLVSRR